MKLRGFKVIIFLLIIVAILEIFFPELSKVRLRDLFNDKPPVTYEANYDPLFRY